MAEPTNEERAARADAALELYCRLTGSSEDDTRLVDLLTDLRHWAARNWHDFDNANFLSEIHFNHEHTTSPQEAEKEAGAKDG